MTFPTTNWARLAEATLSGGETERAALTEFCEMYWKPIASVIRNKGVRSDRVEDLTQDFFLKLIEESFLRRAVEKRGKFRSFLLKALRNFLADDARKSMASKRGGDLSRVELKDDSASLRDDELEFDSAWAEAIFDSAVERTAVDVIKKRGQEKWNAIKVFATGLGELISYDELGRVLEMNPAGTKTEVWRVRKLFRENLRFEVAKTVSAPHEVEEEMFFLKEVLMNRPVQ